MAINKCFNIHLDLADVLDLDVLINKIIKVGSITMADNNIVVWLYDDKNKDDLIKALKKAKIKDYFCEKIEYETIAKDKNFNFVSSWFMENYNAYLIREAEKKNQDALNAMYENIQRAEELLDNKIKQGQQSLEDKKN